MFYHIVLYAAFFIFVIGLIYKISTWFRLDIGIHIKDVPPSARFMTALRGICSVIFSPKLFALLKVFVLDVLLQTRILKEDSHRWFMHILIFWGFMFLLAMHALDNYISEALFSEYYSTLNPFLFLRNFFGILVIVGICMAIYRRFVLKVPRLNTSAMDRYAIIVLAVIMLSGFILEGIKITSYTRYQEMVEEYGDMEGDEELQALESYWVNSYGLASPHLKRPFDEDVLEQGMELNESCISCHSKPQWAVGGYAVAWIIRPVAAGLDSAGIPNLLWLIHILACFVGLAYLPFSKMFHILTTPLSLMANAVMDKNTSAPANIATRQIMELDACTRCSTCSLRCSVAVASDCIGNKNILPSERISFLKTFIKTKALDKDRLKAIQEGIYLCTNCDRCTVVCPSGINLRDLWFSAREVFLKQKHSLPLMLTPFSYYRGLNKTEIDPAQYDRPLKIALEAVTEKYEQKRATRSFP
ncbi:4Fe-4S dicluster domain-containing protein [Thermodesulfobacteriota bacterium]